MVLYSHVCMPLSPAVHVDFGQSLDHNYVGLMISIDAIELVGSLMQQAVIMTQHLTNSLN